MRKPEKVHFKSYVNAGEDKTTQEKAKAVQRILISIHILS